MSDLDDEIREALKEDQEQLFKDDDDLQAYYDSLMYMFRGSTKWFTALHLGFMAVFITMIIVSAFQFFAADTTRGMIAWAAGFCVSVTLEVISELFFMIEINKHVIRWEIKQLQLQVAAGGTLAAEISPPTESNDQ